MSTDTITDTIDAEFSAKTTPFWCDDIMLTDTKCDNFELLKVSEPT